MKGWRIWALYGFLLLGAGMVALGSRRIRGADDSPSVRNSDPRGLRALYLYLTESGREARALEGPLQELPTDLHSLVLAGATKRELDENELTAVQNFVSQGNTLVYLTPRDVHAFEPGLSKWLLLEAGVLNPPSSLRGERTLTVSDRAGPFAEVEKVETRVSHAVAVGAKDAVRVAGEKDETFIWRVPHGKGEVYVFSGTDFADNQSIDAAENIQFWDALSRRGPIAFDEWHQSAEPPPPASPALLASMLQIVFVVLVLFWARGVRLGPARPPVYERHRSTREYLESFGWLLQRARVENELAKALHKRVRRRLWDTSLVSPTASDAEAAVEWAARSGQPAERFLAWSAAMKQAIEKGTTPAALARLTRDAAELEGRT